MQTSTKHPRKKHLQVPIIYQKKRGVRFPYRISILFYLMLGLAVWQEAWAVTKTTTGVSTNWNNSNSWSPSGIPGPNDAVVIAHNMNLDLNTTCYSLIINPNNSLSIGSYSLEVSNNIILSEITSGTGTTILNIGSGAVECANITMNGGSNGNRKAEINITTGTLDILGSLTFTTTNTSPNTTLKFTDSGTLKIGGILGTGGTFTAGTTSTVEFNGVSVQTIPAYAYANITITNSEEVKPLTNIVGTPTANTISVSGKISIQNTGVFNNDGKTITGTTGQIFEILHGAKFITATATPFPGNYTLSINSISDPYATVQFEGSAANIPTGTYGKIKIMGGDKTLAGNVTAKQFDLSGGSLILSNYDLTMQQPATFSGASSISYIKQTGSGDLIIENLGTGIGGTTTEVLFPIGTANSYTPAYITNSGPKDNFSVRVEDGVKDHNQTTVVTDNVVHKTWHVDKVTANGTANVTLKLQWNSSDQSTTFNSNKVGISHYYAGVWHYPPSFAVANGSGPFTTTLTGITHFSPFGVGNDLSPLPVELISFTATKKENAAYLQWVTASEKNNAGFHIQTSADGRNFEDISFVASRNPNSSTTQQYDFLDKTVNTAAVRYYRLKQSDFDGKVSFSDIKAVDFTKQPETPQIYPNPFTSQINFNLQTDRDDELRYQVMDMTGKTVYQSTQKVTKGNNAIQINLEKDHPAGFYLLRTQSSSNITSHRLIKQ